LETNGSWHESFSMLVWWSIWRGEISNVTGSNVQYTIHIFSNRSLFLLVLDCRIKTNSDGGHWWESNSVDNSAQSVPVTILWQAGSKNAEQITNTTKGSLSLLIISLLFHSFQTKYDRQHKSVGLVPFQDSFCSSPVICKHFLLPEEDLNKMRRCEADSKDRNR